MNEIAPEAQVASTEETAEEQATTHQPFLPGVPAPDMIGHVRPDGSPLTVPAADYPGLNTYED